MILYLGVLYLVLLLLIINKFVPYDMSKIVSQTRFFVRLDNLNQIHLKMNIYRIIVDGRFYCRTIYSQGKFSKRITL